MTKLLRWNVAALLSVAAMQTMAAGVPTDNNTLLMAGATAVDRTLLESWIDGTDGLCDPANSGAANPLVAEVFFVGAAPTALPVTSPANFLVRCSVKAGVTGITAGTVVGYGKFSGGSETGIQPVATLTATGTPGVTVTYPNPAAATCTAGTFLSAAGFVDVIVHGNCGPGITAGTAPYGQALNPRAGIADVEPKLFGLTTTNVNGIAGANVGVESAVDVTFAPVVSRNFFAALQAAEGLGAPCTSLTAQTAGCLPSLTLAQIRGLYSGKISPVDLSGVAAQATAPVAGVGNTQFRICRRANTSGTQKSFENFFFSQGCRTSGSQNFVVDSAPLNPANNQPCSEVGCAFADAQIGATGIFQGTGSGDVESCLDDAVAEGVYALGILSTDRVPNDTTKEFNYIKLDGVVPTLQSVADGKYSFFSEDVFLTTQNAAVLPIPQQPIINAVKARLRTPGLLDGTLANIGLGAGTGGLLVRPVGGTAPNAPGVVIGTRPVNSQVKSTSFLLTTIDNCTVPALTNGTDSAVSAAD